GCVGGAVRHDAGRAPDHRPRRRRDLRRLRLLGTRVHAVAGGRARARGGNPPRALRPGPLALPARALRGRDDVPRDARPVAPPPPEPARPRTRGARGPGPRAKANHVQTIAATWSRLVRMPITVGAVPSTFCEPWSLFSVSAIPAMWCAAISRAEPRLSSCSGR